MLKRKLKRQLGLLQVIMLGTAGAIGAQMFVLTGVGAGMAGPAFILAIVVGGLLNFSIALNYGELASTFPETGGAMTYVREAWGRGLLSYIVGSLDCLSSTFFAALSAVGFSYSLQIFFPGLPVVPTALAAVLVFAVLNVLGVANIGNVQIFLGGFLLVLLFGYVLLGFVLPGGFSLETYLTGGSLFVFPDPISNLGAILSTIALIYVAYIGFEVIADDAEEIKDPDRNLPLGILLSLTLLIIIYPLITLVTLGTVPWNVLAGSETALTDAVVRFLPGWGPAALGLAGIIATLTSLNTAMLSATREAFTLSRDGSWPRPLSRLGRFHTPYVSVMFIGVIIAAVAAIGLVDFLSYISSSGYLFVLFWSNLALTRLRKRYPGLKRPFKVPLYPLTVYLAVGTCFLIIIFTDRRALLFGAVLLAVLSLAYYLAPAARRIYLTRIASDEKIKNRILVPIANPRTSARLVRLAAIMAQASEDTSLCVFNVLLSPANDSAASRQPPGLPQSRLPPEILREAQKRNVPLYTKRKEAPDIASGVLEEIESAHDIKFVMVGWPGPPDPSAAVENPVKTLLEKAPTNMAVLLSQNSGNIRHILVPIGGSLHSRLALKVAFEIADQENARLTALHAISPSADIEDELLYLREVVVDELGTIPLRLTSRVAVADSVVAGVLDETKRQVYDLLVMGASEEYSSGTRLFGSVGDWIVEHLEHCSVLVVRQHESVAVHWLRRQVKRMDKSGPKNGL